MKRDENLFALSWQHHNGLMAVLLLKKGLQKKADPAVMRDFILQIKNDELDEHFAAEEQVLLAYSEKYPSLSGLYKKMKDEHKLLRQCYTELESASCEVIEKFYRLLEQHIRFEEREFFPMIEETLTPQELSDIGSKLTHLPHQSCSNFPIKFWE